MVTLAGYDFQGPYLTIGILNEKAGVYAILCQKEKLAVLDVGQSEDVTERVSNHERKDLWELNCLKDKIRYVVYYEEKEATRLKIEKEVRGKYYPPCGEV